MSAAPPSKPSRPTAVLDVNVLVSALIGRRHSSAPPARILSAWKRGKFILTLSTAMIEKVDEVLHRPTLFPFLSARFSADGAEKQIQEFLKSLRRQARVTSSTLDLQVVEADPEDDAIIIAAVEGKADCIVSGDRHLKNLGSYKNIPILSPSKFVICYKI